MARLVIGTHGYYTAPEVLERYVDDPKVKVMHPIGPMFHPKLYSFDLGNTLEIYVGSSNMTMGGLRHNIECGVFMRDIVSSLPLQELNEHLVSLWSDAKKLDDDFVTSYKANHRRVRNAKKELEEYVEIKKPRISKHSANNISPQSLDWSTFRDLVVADKKHKLSDRLNVLAEARQLFARPITFEHFTEIEQKCIAGILKPPDLDGIHWAYFGQMSAFGRYSPIIRAHVARFSRALDEIPLQGPIREAHYNAYLAEFKTIPSASGTWIGMGTRLLAMKRPDYFVCIDSANRDGLCNHFSSAPSTTDLDNYWSRIIAPMMASPWWQAEMPAIQKDQQIWMGRAAMLDAIYYDPKQR